MGKKTVVDHPRRLDIELAPKLDEEFVWLSAWAEHDFCTVGTTP
jgi:hypothetical protein